MAFSGMGARERGSLDARYLMRIEEEGTIASAATVDIGAESKFGLNVTGSTAITSLGSVANVRKRLRFSGALTLTHNGTSLILPGGANITTAAGDIAEFVSDNSGNWRCVFYTVASAAPVASVFPSGMVAPFAISTAPAGWLECDGAAVSRTTYAALFAAIGTTFGSGDGSATFNLPDLRGEFVRGWDNGKGTDSGRTFGSSQTDAFQGHWHDYEGNYSLASGSTTNMENINGAPYNTSFSDKVKGAVTDGSNGTPRTADETRPRNIALMYCVKT